MQGLGGKARSLPTVKRREPGVQPSRGSSLAAQVFPSKPHGGCSVAATSEWARRMKEGGGNACVPTHEVLASAHRGAVLAEPKLQCKCKVHKDSGRRRRHAIRLGPGLLLGCTVVMTLPASLASVVFCEPVCRPPPARLGSTGQHGSRKADVVVRLLYMAVVPWVCRHLPVCGWPAEPASGVTNKRDMQYGGGVSYQPVDLGRMQFSSHRGSIHPMRATSTRARLI